MAINIVRMYGGQHVTNAYLYCDMVDSGYPLSADRPRIAQLRWWAGVLGPRPVMTQNFPKYNIENTIVATYPGTVVTQLNMMGVREPYVYFGYRDTAAASYHIAEFNATTWAINRRINAFEYNTGEEVASISGYGNIIYICTTDIVNSNMRRLIRTNSLYYNGSSEQFEYLGASKSVLYNYGTAGGGFNGDGAIHLSAGNNGVLALVSVELNAPEGKTTKYVAFDTNFNETLATSAAREQILGWHNDRPWNNNNPQITAAKLAGVPGGRMFTSHLDMYFHQVGRAEDCIVEWDASTFECVRVAPLTPYPFTGTWDDSDIQNAEAMTRISMGYDPPIDDRANCTIMGVGGFGDNIYTTTRYHYKEDETLDTIGSHYRDFGPAEPTEAGGGHTAWNPSTKYRFEQRIWPDGVDFNAINIHKDADMAKPSHWVTSKPWWLIDVVCAPASVYLLLATGSSDGKEEQWLLHFDANSLSLMNQHQIITGDNFNNYNAASIAGDGYTIYIYQNSGFNAEIATWDTTTWTQTGLYSVGGYRPGRMDKIAGDGLDGYIYSTYLDSSVNRFYLQRRNAGGAFEVSSDPGVNQTDWTGLYYDTATWVLNPLDPTSGPDPRLWAFGGNSDKLYVAGLDVIGGTTDMIIIEVDPATLEYVRHSNVCINWTHPTDIPAQTISFW